MNKSAKLVVLLALFLVMGLSHSAGVRAESSLTTDKADYAPEELVTVTGTGFTPGQSYAIPIVRPDNSIVYGDGSFIAGWDTVTADESGAFTYNYQLDGIQGIYNVYVYPSSWTGDLSETPIASTTFTDFLRFYAGVSPSSIYYALTTQFTVTIYSVQYDVIGSSMIRIEPTSAGTWGYPTLLSISGDATGWGVYRTERGILKIHSHGDDLQPGESMTVTFTMAAPVSTHSDETFMYVDGYSNREADGDSGSHYFRQLDVNVYVPPHMTVNTDPASVDSTTGSGYYLPGTVATISAPEYKEVLGQSKHYFSGWTVSGSGTVADASAASTTFQVYGNPVVTAHYLSEYYVAFSVNGLDANAGTNTVLTLNEIDYNKDNLPSGIWVDGGTTFTWASNIPITSTEQFAKAGQTGTSPITAAGTYSATYQKQWKTTFAATGLDSDAGAHTVLTVEATNYAYNALPIDAWVNSGATFTWADPVAGVSANEKFVKTGQTGGSPITGTGTYSADYQKQWRVTFTATGLDADAAENTVLTLDDAAYQWDNLPSGVWVDSGTTFTWADPLPVGSTEKFVLTGHVGGSPAAGDTYSATYQKQWQVSFNVSGLDSDAASNTVLTVGTMTYALGDFPVNDAWVNSGTSYSWTDPITVGSNEKFVKTGQTGDSPVTAAGTHSAAYQKQWYISITSAHGSLTQTSQWVNDNDPFSASVTNPDVVAADQHRWLLTGLTIDSVAETVPDSVSYDHVQASRTIVFSWTEQYKVTFSATGFDSDVDTNTVLTLDGTDYALNALPSGAWVNSEATFSWVDPITVSSTKKFVKTAGSDGSVTAIGTYSATYQKQCKVSASYSTSDVSTPLGGVVLSGTQVGIAYTPTLTTSVQYIWLDAGTAWSVNNPIPASPTTERWYADDGTSGTVGSSTTIAPLYIHQYKMTLSYSVVGGGSSIAPTFTANQLGSSADQVLTTTATGYWFDSGASWMVTNPLTGSDADQRWYTSHDASGTVSTAATIAFDYYHQYRVIVNGYRDGGYFSGPTFQIDYTSLGALHSNSHQTTYWETFVDDHSSVTIHDVQTYYPDSNGVSGVRYVYDNGWTAPIEITVNSNIPLNYVTQYRLTIQTDGLPSSNPTNVYLGGSSTSDGTAYDGHSFTKWFDKNTNTGTISVEPSLGFYLFTGWDDATTINPHADMLMSTAQTLTANYISGYTVTFTESGLASGTSWSMSFNGVTHSSTTDTITFTEVTPGSGYWYHIPTISVSSNERYAPNPLSGTLDVSSDTSQSITYYHQYRVTAKSQNDDLGDFEPVTFQYDCTSMGTSHSNVDGWTGLRYISQIHLSIPWMSWVDAQSTLTIHNVQAYYPNSIGASGVRYKYDNGWTAPITIDSSRIITLNYVTQYQLTIQTDGLPSEHPTNVYLGGSPTSDGTAYDGHPFTKWVDKNTYTGAIGVDASVLVEPGTRYGFYEWTDEVSANPRGTILMTNPITYTADYGLQYLVTFQYSLSDSSTPNAPTAHYTKDGLAVTKAAALVPATTSQDWVDSGSSVSYTNPIDNAAGERWKISPEDSASPYEVTGSVTASTTLNPTYFHQYYATFQYTIDGPISSTSHGDPDAKYTKFGGASTSPAKISSPSSDWVDAGTAIKYTNPLSTSSTSERWVISVGGVTHTTSGDVTVDNSLSDSKTLNPTYYHQFQVTLTYTGDTIVGSGVKLVRLRAMMQIEASPTSTKPVSIGFIIAKIGETAYTGNGVIWNSNTLGVATNNNIPNPGVATYVVTAELDPNNYYYGNIASVALTVYSPNGQFVTGGGWVWDSDPSTGYSSHGNFGFVVNYNKNQMPKGSFVYTWRSSDGYDYVIKSNAWTGLGVPTNQHYATFQGKANVQKIDPSTGETIWSGGNFQFTVDAYDYTGTTTNGGADAFHMKVLNPDGTLFHEIGKITPLLSLSGGQIIIHT